MMFIVSVCFGTIKHFIKCRSFQADQDFKVTRTHGVKLYFVLSAFGYSLNVGFYPRINAVKEHENGGHFGIRFQYLKKRERVLIYKNCVLAGQCFNFYYVLLTHYGYYVFYWYFFRFLRFTS